jgi:enterochelin esterase-like enzyme
MRRFTALIIGVILAGWTHGSSQIVVTVSQPVPAGVTSSPSYPFTVSLPSGTFNGSQTVTISDGSQGGTFTPSVGSPGTNSITVTPAGGASGFTFTYSAASTGNKSISVSNGQGWANAAPVTYYANTAANWYGNTWNNPGGAPTLTGVSHGSYHSNIMNQDIGFNIYLPPGYSTSTHYPVVYSFDGDPTSENVNPPIVQPYVQSKIVAATVKPMIYVFPATGWKGMNAVQGAPAYGAYMAEATIIYELIPYIDANYSTIASKAGRALSGFSGGGEVCDRLVFKFPQMFSSAYCYASAVDDTSANIQANEPGGYANMLNSIAANWTPMAVWGLTVSNQNALVAAAIPLHATVGDSDSLESTNVALFAQLDNLSVPHDPLTVATGCGHSFTCDMTFTNGADVDFASAHFP